MWFDTARLCLKYELGSQFESHAGLADSAGTRMLSDKMLPDNLKSSFMLTLFSFISLCVTPSLMARLAKWSSLASML